MAKHFGELSASDRVNKVLRCPFTECNTRVIVDLPLVDGTLVKVTNAPTMVSSKNDDTAPNQFYVVNDVWDFDNIGVSKLAEGFANPEIDDFNLQRLIVCSECDRGPLGFAGFIGSESDVKNLKYYLSAASVVYD